MNPWPFSLISPEDFALMTKREKSRLQCITAACLAFVLAHPTTDEGSTDHIH